MTTGPTGAAPGQFAVTNTSGWVARVIQWVTHSAVNHAIICVHGTGPDAQCIEARPHGAGWVKAGAYPHAIWSDWLLTSAERSTIVNWAAGADGTPYGWLDCIAAGLDSLHKRHRWIPATVWAEKRLAKLRTMDCSQLVAMAYAAAGIQLCKGEQPYQVTPGDLYDVLLKHQGAAKP